MKKRIIAIILSIIMLIPAVAFASNSSTPALYEKEISFIQSLGIIKTEGFNPEGSVTRGEFAKLITDLYYKDVKWDEAAYPSSFTDIPAGANYASAVAFLEGMKIVNGNSSKTFSPDSPILMKDAIVILIRTLGYEMYAKASGGYFSGYVIVANNIKLTNGLVQNNEELDYKTAAKLLYNSLFVSTVGLDYVNEEGIFTAVKTGEDYLSETLGITTHTAILMHDGMRSFDNRGVLENQIILKDVKTNEEILVNVSDSSVCEYFGNKVEAYIKTDEETEKKELVHIRVHKDVKIQELDASDLTTVTTSYAEYEEDESGKTVKIKFDTSSVYFFVNGYKLSVFSASDLIPTYGKVKYIDNNNDGKMDVVLVEDIKRHVVAASTPTETKRILCKASAANSIDLSDSNIAYRIVKDGKICDIEDISENDIISLAYADKPLSDGSILYTLYISNKLYSGELSATEDEKLFFGEDEFELSKLFLRANPNLFDIILVGMKYTVRFDSYGKIAHIDDVTTTALDYCYLLNIRQNSMYGDVLLNFYSKNACFNELKISDKVVIDGVSMANGSENFKERVITALSKRYNPDEDKTEIYSLTAAEAAAYNKSHTAIVPRPAIIKINAKGEVYYIDTDYPTYTNKKLDAQDIYTLTPGKREYRDKMLRVNSTSTPSTIDGSFFINGSTIVMLVPDIDRYGMPTTYNTEYANIYELSISDIENYAILTEKKLHTSDKYDIQPYNIDDATGVADFVIIRGDTYFNGEGMDKDYHTVFYIFDSLNKIADNSGNNNEIYRLYYTAGGKKESVTVNKTTLDPLVKNLIFGEAVISPGGTELFPAKQGLAKGDLICIDSRNGEVVAVRRHISINNINEKIMVSNQPMKPSSGYVVSNASAPYDQSNTSVEHMNSTTYVSQLAVPLNGKGYCFKVMTPYNSSGSQGALKDYYTGGINVNGYRESYINFGEDRIQTCILVEEVAHSENGKCEIRVKPGSVSDIKYMDAYGFFEASRMYVTYSSGEARHLIIYNLLPEHNGE